MVAWIKAGHMPVQKFPTIYLYQKHHLISQYKYLATSTCILQFNIDQVHSSHLLCDFFGTPFLCLVRTSTQNLCKYLLSLCLEIGHLGEGGTTSYKLKPSPAPLGVGISTLDFSVSTLYLLVTHLTEPDTNYMTFIFFLTGRGRGLTVW